MASESVPQNDRMKYWNERWAASEIGFHKSDVHHLLLKHMDKICTNGQPKKIFVPLCGKTLDMKWFSDQGIEVCGIDGVQTALEQFFTEHGLEWEETKVPALGASGKLLSSKDGNIKLYCGDFMAFSTELSGSFDAVWDRASIVAIKREDLQRYVEIMKELVKPGGRILTELLQYDIAVMDDITAPTKPPPPHPMYEEDIKRLYEPQFSIQYLDQDDRKIHGKDAVSALFLLVRN